MAVRLALDAVLIAEERVATRCSTAPEAANAFQYRIKSETDGHERVVREDQIERW